jgi:hypothetical protein
MLSKLFLRKAQGLLDASEAAKEREGVYDADGSQERYISSACATLLEARRRGLFASSAPASKEFLELEARLPVPLPAPPEEEVEEGARMPLREVCELLLGGFHHDPPRTEEQLDGLVSGLATVLRNQAMDPPSASATEPGSGVSLLWALATGLERYPTDATCDYFERAVEVLLHAPTGEQPVPINMRLGRDGTLASRTALMHAARAVRPSAVRKLLSLGADPVLRDARGVTALMLACTSDAPTLAVTAPPLPADSPPHRGACSDTLSSAEAKPTEQATATAFGRDEDPAYANAPPVAAVEVAQLLLDAGAAINAQDIAGQTALMYACSALHLPLLTHLLGAGARADLISATGRSAISILSASRWGDPQPPTVYDECLSRVLAAWPAERRPHAEEELRAMRFVDMLERELAPVNNRLVGRAGEMGVKQKGEQLDAVLRALLRHVKMDEALLDTAGRGKGGGVGGGGSTSSGGVTAGEGDGGGTGDGGIGGGESGISGVGGSGANGNRGGEDGSGIGGAPPPLSNFLFELHARAVAVIPPALTTVYRAQPSADAFALITQHSRDALTKAETAATNAEARSGLRTAAYDRDTLSGAVMVPYRHRGRIAERMRDCLDLVIEPIRRGVSYAIPSREALAALKRLSPIVECGAGSGYWARMLRDAGADVLAFDSQPPTVEGNNACACRTFCEVTRADCAALFDEHPDLAQRTLLMVWPGAGVEGSAADAAPWDVLCLTSFIRAGGRRVAYVGEREQEIEHIAGKPMDSGMSASGQFQALLRSRFRLSSVVGIPQLPFAVDDLSIWECKGAT